MRLAAKAGARGKAKKSELDCEPAGDKSLNRLRCLNCGQHIFVAVDSEPPEICQYCDDMTTWRLMDA